jgi:hypothetical protein
MGFVSLTIPRRRRRGACRETYAKSEEKKKKEGKKKNYAEIKFAEDRQFPYIEVN